MVGQDTQKIGSALHAPFKELANRLSGDYGGVMEHLWIDLELLRSHAKEDGSAKHPFRFQKRVSGRGPFGLPDQPDSFNVGHFSVRPDFDRLLLLPMDEVIPYVLSLIYRASGVLIEKKKKLGAFDAELFLTRFKAESHTLGFEFESLFPTNELGRKLKGK
ncbi:MULTISPECIES: hypothetical protein [unclassified Rhizobacter]|nr:MULTISPECIES: hypothetical protein [unclassified Rhizobacter]KQU71480.1 hypothetical protein ASC88_07000 [Rhizobacter sp. Root29]KQW13030.1 hypothetical protein ASC98_18510 [Rhizobacter sp. Root1238]KRB10882.1 hypothetical protein ASE08_29075 [Rhizobacter sp. Root16D2]